jgi:vitamin B12 transporter
MLSVRLLAFSCALAVCASPAFSQQNEADGSIPEVVVTATRSPLERARAGSAISVVSSEEIEAYASRNIIEALRLVPGVDVSEQGGPGGFSAIRLRGSEAAQTLILVDGIRIGDPSSTGGEFNFSSLSVGDIDRIEVLRGPQSALYGSDAMGGVINIITRKGERTPRRSITIEAGSYGTINTRADMSGATDRTSYAFSLTGFHTNGFSSYGYRIPRIEALYPGGMEKDGAEKASGSARISHRLGEATFEFGFSRHYVWARYDDPSAFDLNPALQRALRDSPVNRLNSEVTTAFARMTGDAFNGALRNSLTVFGNLNDRVSLDRSCFDPLTFASLECRSTFSSRRYGAEYQGNLGLGERGLLIFGARAEREEAENVQKGTGGSTFLVQQLAGAQNTQSVFALHQITLGSRLDLSLGGRIDAVQDVDIFPTWRTTAAYRISETGTKLRASAGTGAKAPSLYQRFSEYGNTALQPEKNIGFDVGIDQSFFGGMANFSATWFDAKYTNLIDIDWSTFPLRYFNIAEARIRGLETNLDLILVPGEWKARLSYTHMQATNLTTGDPLPRRPRDKGGVSLTYTGVPKLEVEGRLILVGERLDSVFAPGVYNPGYLRFDIRSSYAFTDNVRGFARIENITNERYEEVLNYGTAGRSIYAGVKVTW